VLPLIEEVLLMETGFSGVKIDLAPVAPTARIF
jgi:hypothetical protein